MTFITGWAIFEVCAWIALFAFINVMLPNKDLDK